MAGGVGVRFWPYSRNSKPKQFLDLLGTVLWTSTLAFAGWELGHNAVDVANAVAHYSLWFTIALIVGITLWSARSSRSQPPRRP